MKVRPILFSGPMIRALLDGRKTQTRLVVKPQPPTGSVLHQYTREHEQSDLANSFGWFVQEAGDLWPCNRDDRARCPYGVPGDILWVRETWSVGALVDEDAPSKMNAWSERPFYHADGEPPKFSGYGRVRPSIHMPRWASRLTLRITDVRVERVQDISEEDAEAEGSFLGKCSCSDMQTPMTGLYATFRQTGCSIHGEEFRALWDSINKIRGYGWDANPWVWAISFDVIQSNIDEVLKKEAA